MSEHSMSPTTSGMPQKMRIRAVVACSHCRSKRSKCDGVPGQQACSQCQQRGIECEMSDGKRNRGHYKPQAEALAKRVRILEEALAEARAANRELVAQQQQQQQQHHHHHHQQAFAPPSAWGHDHTLIDDASSLLDLPNMDVDTHSIMPPTAESVAPSSMPPPLHNFSAHQSHHPSHYVLDHGSIVVSGGGGGGHAMSMSRSSLDPAAAASSAPDSRTTETACCADLDLSPPLVDYLLGLFFHRYQMMMKFVSQQDFVTLHHLNNNGDDSGYCRHKHRSALFLAMLAAGLRYSTRPTVTDRFQRPDGENKLASAARRAVEKEVARPTLATVQTVLILCEVETSLDNQMTGYMYSCLASKLIFEMGLDLGSSTSSTAMTAEETSIRHWLVWAASVHDQFWAVFLRRPLAIKNQALQLSRLAWRSAKALGADSSSNYQLDDDVRQPSSFEDEVNDDLMDLMELAREMTDELYGSSSPFERHTAAAAAAAAAVAAEVASASSSSSYDGGGLPHSLHQHAAQQHACRHVPDVASLDARLDRWFASLSEKVRQGPVSGHDCYHFLFVLHMHFNATKIILHRTRAFRSNGGGHGGHSGPPTSSYPLQSPVTPSSSSGGRNSNNGGGGGGGSTIDSAAAASIATLGHASICIAKLFETFRRREDIRTLQCTGVQWAGMASEALAWYIETLPIDGAVEAIAHLQSLGRTLKDMSRTFRPAVYPYERTNHDVRMFWRRIDGIDGPDSPPPVTPGRGPSPAPNHPRQQLQQQQQQQPHTQQAPLPAVDQQHSRGFDMNPSSHAYGPDPGHHLHHGMHLDGHCETASIVPSAPDLATTTATATTFTASLTTAAAPTDGSISVASLSAASKNPGVLQSEQWSEQDPWDWNDLLER